MKGLLNFIGAVLTVFMVIWDILEILAIPILFTIIGILNSFPKEYYLISIGGYFALFIVAEIAARLIFKALDKRYTPILERKLRKYFDKSSKND